MHTTNVEQSCLHNHAFIMKIRKEDISQIAAVENIEKCAVILLSRPSAVKYNRHLLYNF